ncbi:MAG TPA: site-2 protease family protein [Gemmatimonadaceae bacterium]|nr:site-2 protease family protein [Gemmatimonadaceae bacterium]
MERLIIVLPVLLFSVIAHEYAHGYAALRQGDPTASQLGRLTWNPVKHIDPFMTLILPVLMAFSNGPILGGAKPVPVNPGNYRHLRRGDIIVSLAGVATNLVIAIGLVPLIFLVGYIAHASPGLAPGLAILQAMLIWGVLLNLILVMFNLLPIPPLDGSHVMKYLLPPTLAVHYQQVGRYGILILILLLYFGSGVLFFWMSPAYRAFSLLVVHGRELILPSQWLPLTL